MYLVGSNNANAVEMLWQDLAETSNAIIYNEILINLVVSATDNRYIRSIDMKHLHSKLFSASTTLSSRGASEGKRQELLPRYPIES